ncbi:MAG: hypothetical protein KME05_09785 [Gloeocapsa sp. UFS-A4-WI-NPMV-4B04]|nr:hypothetical protein [Gloeocapsa sp. UFS-A4-WI-NPMV-4B04]
MKTPKQNLKILDYTQENASKTLVPNLPTLSSFGCWSNRVQREKVGSGRVA